MPGRAGAPSSAARIMGKAFRFIVFLPKVFLSATGMTPRTASFPLTNLVDGPIIAVKSSHKCVLPDECLFCLALVGPALRNSRYRTSLRSEVRCRCPRLRGVACFSSRSNSSNAAALMPLIRLRTAFAAAAGFPARIASTMPRQLFDHSWRCFRLP